MSRVNVSVEHLYQQGFGPASRRIGVRGLARMGDNLTFSTCVQGYDANSNPVPCNDPSAVIWMDENGNAMAVPSSGVQSVFGTEEFGSAAPGSGGSYPGVPNPSPSRIAVQTFPQTVGLPPGPANRVNVPVWPPTATSLDLFFRNNWPLLAAVGAGILVIGGLSGAKRRR